METTRKLGINGFQLKIIGIILMFGDHIHEMFASVGAPLWLTMLGRVVAPIFLFMSVEGCIHTKNIVKYLGRLLIGYYIMDIGNLLIPRAFPTEIGLINNIFGSLFLGVFYIYFGKQLKDGIQNKNIKKTIANLLLCLLPFVFSAIALISSIKGWILGLYIAFAFPNPLLVEGGITFILLIIAMYLTRKNRWLQVLMIVIASMISALTGGGNLFTQNYQWMMVFSAIPILLYNGQKG